MIYLGDLALPAMAVRSVSGSDGSSWSSHDVIENKPLLQWMGPTGRDLSVSLYLHVAFVDARRALNALIAMATLGEPFAITTAAGRMWGTFVLRDVQYKFTWLLKDGTPLALTVDLSLGEPGEADSPPTELPPALAAYATPEVLAAWTEDTSSDPDDVTPEEIVRR